MPLLLEKPPDSNQLIEFHGKVVSAKNELNGFRYWRSVDAAILIETKEAGVVSGRISGGLNRLAKPLVINEDVEVSGYLQGKTYDFLIITAGDEVLLTYQQSLDYHESRIWIVYAGQVFLILLGGGLTGLGYLEIRARKKAR